MIAEIVKWLDAFGINKKLADLRSDVDAKASASYVDTQDAAVLAAAAAYTDTHGGGGGGAVSSVQGQTGAVTLDTSDIADSTDARYVTDAQRTVIGNTSGTNSGDETNATIKTKLGAASASGGGYLSSADWTAFDAKQAALAYTAENSSNKENSVLDTSTTKYPTNALVKASIEAAVTGLIDYRGDYDASGNAFPASGGSGASGAVLKGDVWIASVAGTLGGVAVKVGDWIIAKVDSPGSTASNWSLIGKDLGYVPEDSANRDTDGALGANSDSKYPSQKATKTYADGKLSKTGAAEISVMTNKATPLDADVLLGEDSASSPTAFGKIKITFAALASYVLGKLSASYLPAGTVRLAGYVNKTDVFSTNSSSYTDWAGVTLTVSQTSGRSNNSKFRLSLTSGVSNDSDNSFQYVALFRSINGGSFAQIALGDTIPNSGQRCWIDAAIGGTAGNYPFVLKNFAGDFVDAPETSNSIVYKCQVIRTVAGTAYFGRSANTSDGNRSSIPTVFLAEEILQ